MVRHILIGTAFNVSFLIFLGENRSMDNSTEAPSSPHDYESVSDVDNQMNQLGSDPVTVIENMEVERTNEEIEEEAGQEGVEANVDTYPASVIGAVNDSSPEAHSHLMMSGGYSSLKDRQRNHHLPAVGGLYSQLGVPTAEVNERDQQNDMVGSIQLSYYNL